MFKNILIPVAPDQEHPPTEALSVAGKLAEEGAAVTLLSVIDDLPAYVEVHMPEGQLEKNAERIAEWLEQKIKGSKLDPKVAVVIGHSSQTILKWSEDHGSDLLIVASHRPGLSDYFLGSTAGRIVRHARCPVMVLR